MNTLQFGRCLSLLYRAVATLSVKTMAESTLIHRTVLQQLLLLLTIFCLMLDTTASSHVSSQRISSQSLTLAFVYFYIYSLDLYIYRVQNLSYGDSYYEILQFFSYRYVAIVTQNLILT